MCKGRQQERRSCDQSMGCGWYKNRMSVILSPHHRVNFKDYNRHMDDGLLECLIKIGLLYNYALTLKFSASVLSAFCHKVNM